LDGRHLPMVPTRPRPRGRGRRQPRREPVRPRGASASRPPQSEGPLGRSPPCSQSQDQRGDESPQGKSCPQGHVPIDRAMADEPSRDPWRERAIAQHARRGNQRGQGDVDSQRTGGGSPELPPRYRAGRQPSHQPPSTQDDQRRECDEVHPGFGPDRGEQGRPSKDDRRSQVDEAPSHAASLAGACAMGVT
jgi:hypothetical protein